ncbi:MAG: winged helix-turn-helix domain-containing protein [Thaumarchaeota archaeon]|nr:winged helix-turn-helix domain-containing protein [Nitrososphaerota archaeon]
MRAFKYIRDPKAFEAIADPTRRKIIYLLRAKEQTVSQLADSLGKTHQAIYHQIGKLLAVDLVEVAKEERVGHFIEAYYRATAEVFEFQHGATSKRESERDLKEGLDVLAKAGIQIRVDQALLDSLMKVESRANEVGVKPELEERISDVQDVGFMAKQHAYKFAQLATMTDRQFDEMIEAERALRKLISSNLVKTKA